MTEHTPGPWYVDTAANVASFAVKPEKPTDAVGVVCACRWRHRRTDHIAEARSNARLIAAAPDLLAALENAIKNAEEALDFMDCRPKYDDHPLKPLLHSIRMPARAAIAKAKSNQWSVPK